MTKTPQLPGYSKLVILEKAGSTLKNEFVGLDQIIDRVIKLISPWYIYPEYQTRPLVINLWGMTGVGKTSLLKRLVELISFNERFYHFDMGNKSGRYESLKTFFRSLVHYQSGFPVILAFDEFQYANTRNMNGMELEKYHSRGIWELLDTGSFYAEREFIAELSIMPIVAELKYLLARGVKVENGVVVDNINYYLTVAGDSRRKRGFDEEEEEYISHNKGISTKRLIRNDLVFIKPHIVDDLYELLSDCIPHQIELRDMLMQMNGEESIAFLEKAAVHAKSQKKIDYSKALVFVLGNLDEAYPFAGIFNPDLSADIIHKQSLSININTIKSALQNRFANEQISRLGNNHIIYPALNRKGYETIILKELSKISSRILVEFGLNLEFDKSVSKLIYSEGVFPTQGTRPLFSTLNNLIDPVICILPMIIAVNGIHCNSVKIFYKKPSLQLTFFDVAGSLIHSHQEHVYFQLENIRTSKNDDLQTVTAVHETGHALLSILLLGKIPSQVFSISSDHSSTGFTIIQNEERMVWSKKLILKKAAFCLAGLAAEKLVFGEENITAGSTSDIKYATHLINNLVKKQGLTGNNFTVGTAVPFSDSCALSDKANQYDDEVKELIQSAALSAENILHRNYYALLDVSQYLAKNSFISCKKLMQILRKHSIVKEKLPNSYEYRKALFSNISTR